MTDTPAETTLKVHSDANASLVDFDSAEYMCPPERNCYRVLDEDDFLFYMVGLAEGHHTLPAERVEQLDKHVASCTWCQREKADRTCPIRFERFIRPDEGVPDSVQRVQAIEK